VSAARIGDEARSRLDDLLDRLGAALRPALDVAARDDATPARALEALLQAAEALAATPDRSGADRLWSGEEGEALAAHLAGLRAALPVLPAQPVATLPGLLDASLEGVVVRGRRALRGRDGGEEHPRVLILGLLEARLQSFDLVVLGGLAEGVWPPPAEPGPWMSRPMRLACGLPAPEERVGTMAHDFAMLACAAPRAILSCPRRREGAPAVPARWLVRLDALLRSKGEVLPHHPAAHWARQLDQPAEGPRPVHPPRPRPPVAARPRSLSVTEIETWQRDPYAIYAKHVLKLAPLKPLEESADASDYGEIVHAALGRFLADHPRGPTPPGAAARLRALMDEELDKIAVRASLAAWWRPRLHRIADWVADAEAARRERDPSLQAWPELRGLWTVPCDGAPFTLRGRADRIELRADGTLAILDYKTGALPGAGDAERGFATQLRLEAAMAAAGAFPEISAGRVTAELAYWHLTGGLPPGDARALFRGDPDQTEDAAREARDGLCRLVARYDDPAQPYLAQPDPDARPRFNDYAQLARVAEWPQGPERDQGPGG
jgi:ATP-dependent helicase/nuclease subunit B